MISVYNLTGQQKLSRYLLCAINGGIMTLPRILLIPRLFTSSKFLYLIIISEKATTTWKIWGIYSGVLKIQVFCDFDAASLGEYFLPLWKFVMLSSFEMSEITRRARWHRIPDCFWQSNCSLHTHTERKRM